MKATIVLIGYCESVISPGPDGRWIFDARWYVGSGRAQCPIESCKVAGVNRKLEPVFGLVFENGVMTCTLRATAARRGNAVANRQGLR